MGGMGLTFTPVLVRCLLGPPGLSEPMRPALLGFMATPHGPIGRYGLPPADHPPHLTHSPLYACNP